MEYRYVVLRHQASLESSEPENFAVLVEGRIPDGRPVIFAVGRSPEPRVPLSEIGMGIVRQFPKVLGNLVQEALENKKPSEDVLDWIHGCMSWNFHASVPRTLTDTDPVHKVAFKLFSEEVAGADQLLQNLKTSSERMTRPFDINERLGETFQTALPVPERAMAVGV